MRILITAGGTSEKIDEVRRLTNTATGRLGALTADELMKRGAEITYVCGENAAVPSGGGAEVIKVRAVSELLDTLTALLRQNKYAAVIHTMAVSDYSVRGFMSIDGLSRNIAEAVYGREQASPGELAGIIRAAILQSPSDPSSRKKISSDIADPILFMEKTPKVINIIKRLQPETVLIGFKLLAGVSEDALLRAGHELLMKNNCDFVLANDSRRIRDDRHEGILIAPDCAFRRLYSKQEIAAAVAEKALGVKESGN